QKLGQLRCSGHHKQIRDTGVSECHEADQLLPNVRKNRRANRNSGTKTSAKLNGRKKSQKAASWTRWTKCVRCASSPKLRPRYSALARMMKPGLSIYPFRMAPKPSIVNAL